MCILVLKNISVDRRSQPANSLRTSNMKSQSRATRSKKLARVGYFDLSKTLGTGNFAVVRLGTHRLTKTHVAVKIVDKNELDAENLEKISREIEILRRLSHRHITQLYQVMETSAFIYIVTEYAANGEIFDFLVNNGRMSEPAAAVKFSQILSAVNYIHSVGVVHRDLKAENLLLDRDFNIKLADFGFSNYYKAGENLSTWCGSPPYAAPELFQGKAYDGPRTDVWSLGVILYALVSGSLPFDGQTLQDLRTRVVSGQFRIPFFLSQECENLIRCMLVVEPSKRLSVQQILRHKWIKLGLGDEYMNLVSEMESISEPLLLNTEDHYLEQVASLLGVHPTQVRDSVVHNNCDDLSSMYHLLLCNAKLAESDRFIGELPPLSPTVLLQSDHVTEIYTDQENSTLEQTEVLNSKGGRRHTLGPSGHPVAIPPSLPFDFNTVLPNTNLPLNIPLVSNHPFAYFSIKDQDLLRPPGSIPGQCVPSLSRRASDCGAYSTLPVPLLYQHRVKEAEDGPAAVQSLLRPRVLNYSTADNDDSSMLERYLVGRGSGKRHTIAGGGISSVLPESPRRRRTGLMTVMEKPPKIATALLHEVESRIHVQRPVSPLAFLLNNDSSHSLPPQSPPPVTSPSKPSLLRQRRTGLTTVLETGKTINGRMSLSKEPYSLPLPADRYPLNRRLSEGAPAFSQFRTIPSPSLPSSTDQSPCEIRALQEEYMQLSKDTRLSQDSGHSSSGYHSPQFLRPPSPPFFFPPNSSSQVPDEDELNTNPSITQDLEYASTQESQLGTQEGQPVSQEGTLSALYEEMYASHDHSARRSSYPNSPAHLKDKHTLTQHLQHLCLTQKLLESNPQDNRIKGSITQGLPSLSATTTPLATPSITPGVTPKREKRGWLDWPAHRYALSGQSSLEEGVSAPGPRFLGTHHPEEYIQIPVDSGFQQKHPQICVTDVMGDQFKYIFSEQIESMDQSS